MDRSCGGQDLPILTIKQSWVPKGVRESAPSPAYKGHAVPNGLKPWTPVKSCESSRIVVAEARHTRSYAVLCTGLAGRNSRQSQQHMVLFSGEPFLWIEAVLRAGDVWPTNSHRNQKKAASSSCTAGAGLPGHPRNPAGIPGRCCSNPGSAAGVGAIWAAQRTSCWRPRGLTLEPLEQKPGILQ